MTKLKSLLFIAFALISYTLTAQPSDCSVMKEGTFKYNDNSSSSIIVFEKNMHYEYSGDKKFVMKSKLKWLSDCEYQATLVENTRPDMQSIPVGTVMNIQITKIDGNIITYTGSVGDNTFYGSFRKIE